MARYWQVPKGQNGAENERKGCMKKKELKNKTHPYGKYNHSLIHTPIIQSNILEFREEPQPVSGLGLQPENLQNFQSGQEKSLDHSKLV